jgi:hypothetical protein
MPTFRTMPIRKTALTESDFSLNFYKTQTSLYIHLTFLELDSHKYALIPIVITLVNDVKFENSSHDIFRY